MKKLIAILLSAVLLFSLAACSDKEKNEAEGTDTDAVVESTAPSEPETSLPVIEEEVFAGLTAVDNEYCRIEIKEITEDYFGNALSVELENKTADTTLYFTTDTCSINGVDTTMFLGESVTAGKTVKTTVTFFDEELIKNGIDKYTDIEVTFRVYEDDNWEADDLVFETVNVYPYGPSKAEAYTRESKATDITVFDTDEAAATVIGWGESDLCDYCIELYLENKSADVEYMFSVSATAINGIEVMNLGTFSLPAGKVSFETIDIIDSTLEANGITDFTDIFFTLRAYDANDWEADDIAENSVHIYPKGEDKAVPYVRQSTAKDKVIVDNESITVIITGITENDTFETQDMGLFIVNKTNENITFSMDNVSVNDCMLDPFFIVSVHPGFAMFTEASWSDYELEDSNIESIEEIEFSFTASSADDWDKDDYFNGKVTYNP